MTRIIYNANLKDDWKNAGKIVTQAIKRYSKSKKEVVLGIVGGRSVPGIFAFLSRQKDIPWKKVHIFMVDERIVPINHKNSNFKLAKETFLDELIEEGVLSKENLHPFIMDGKEKDYGISKYANQLKKHGGKFDIVILSSGEDGHVGALYPNHSSIKSSSEFFVVMEDSPKPPAKRMTASRKLLEKSKTAVILFLGEAKKDALKRFSDKKLDLVSCPAKIVNYIDEAYVLTDIKL
ncbi:6-phosphogluconolactonase [Candidatus Woesearchaeota archaeon]|nr:6-phosphogluconolactonase [Candidatus Woesearchaeota archaeon]